VYKLVVLAVLCANGLYWTRQWRPSKAGVGWAACRGLLWGALSSALLSLALSLWRPGPFHLSIFFMGLAMLLVPTWTTACVILALRKPAGPSFAEVMAGVEGPAVPSANAPTD
jgi:hypothetical protein